MNVSVRHVDVVEHIADALIYSTNVFLNCSGGVGSTLMTRYGNHFQRDLHALLEGSNVKYADQGAIYEMVSEGMPYKAVFHTVPCDGFYDTSIELVTDILSECLNRCVELGNISTIAVSVLASGYGRMEPAEFLRIASGVLNQAEYDSIDKATICIYDEYLFQQALIQIEEEGLGIAAY